ncbi:MAG: glutathione S-transferase family protein [Pseudomonadota bacterium]
MADKPVLYGFDGSTYVRTLRIILRNKGVDYDQVPVNVLEGEPRQPEHLARHPFGKVPVLDIDDMRILETDACCRYLEATRPGPSAIPVTPKNRARMNTIISMVNSYGYPALIGAAGYHLFPDFLGGKDDAAYAKALEDSKTLLTLFMQIKGDSPWLASEQGPSLADYFLGPIIFYVALTPAAEALMAIPGMQGWWDKISTDEAFKATEPDLG